MSQTQDHLTKVSASLAAARSASARQKAQEQGPAALARLVKVAQQGSGQSGVVGRFLLGLYSSYDYPFALVELRRLDHDLFEDCLRVLQLDNQPVYELHDYLQDGSVIFAKLCQAYGQGGAA
tara:strand:- start:4795 stop:5160 length:366 start_codon:yes stop_codon:yes gene_type:complete